MITGWLEGAEGFLNDNGLNWDDVEAVGLAIPGPYLEHGVMGRQPNLPKSLEGWHFLDELAAAISSVARRPIPVYTANDGLLAGVAEARILQKTKPGSVLMLSPGSGLGASFVAPDGKLLAGDHGAAVILGHVPMPHACLELPRFECGCGRDWGCVESYTSISGLPQLLVHVLPEFPGHPLADASIAEKEKALSLRGLAQKGDALALKIFDIQAKAMGYAVAIGGMAYDPTHIIIGGGLMDEEATTEDFRQRYLEGIRVAAATYAWTPVEKLTFQAAVLGELSQAIGAAMLAQSSGS